jgi:hypothetical protein
MLTEDKRPQFLKDITGQKAATDFLTAWVKQYKDTGTADAFLFHSQCGGTGKTSLAYALANELGVDFCFEKIDSSRCNVDTVRALKDDLMLAPFEGKWKIVLVDEADTMSLAAKDGWLSLLEAIPKFRLIIFTTNNVKAFDLVWQSRVKLIELHPHSDTTLTKIMQKAVPAGRTVPDAVLNEIAAKAQGNARAALQALEMHMLSSTQEDDDLTQTVTEIIAPPKQEEPKRADPTPVVPVADPSPAHRSHPADAKSGAAHTLRPSSTGRAGFIEIAFPENPGRQVCDELKGAGFRWSRFNSCWYGQKDRLPARYQATIKQPSSKPEVRIETQEPVVAVARTRPVSVRHTVQDIPRREVVVPAVDKEKASDARLPGLEVRPTLGKDNTWSVIHTGSGRAIGTSYQNLPSKAEAESLMQRVLHLADWTKPVGDLHKIEGLKEQLISAVQMSEPAKPVAPAPVVAATPKIEPKPEPKTEIKIDFAAKLRSLMTK